MYKYNNNTSISTANTIFEINNLQKNSLKRTTLFRTRSYL